MDTPRRIAYCTRPNLTRFGLMPYGCQQRQARFDSLNRVVDGSGVQVDESVGRERQRVHDSRSSARYASTSFALLKIRWPEPCEMICQAERREGAGAGEITTSTCSPTSRSPSMPSILPPGCTVARLCTTLRMFSPFSDAATRLCPRRSGGGAPLRA